jgi:hypothetical protein
MEHVQVPAAKSYTPGVEYYWHGNYSVCQKNGSIETFIVNYLKKYNCSFIIDNTDCLTVSNYNTWRSYLTRPDKIIGALCTRDPCNALLLPLDDNTFTHGLILNGKDNPWEKRIPIAFWRGRCTGLNDIRTNVTKLLTKYVNSDVKLNEDCMTALIHVDNLAPRCSIETYMNYKYIFIIDGTFIASNHQWVFGSGSVPIMITHPDNKYWFKSYLKPMVNYVPIQYDLSDLKDKIEWLIQHDDLAKSISEEAMKLSKELFTSKFQQTYLIDQIHRLCPTLTEYKDEVVVYDYRVKQSTSPTVDSLFERVQHYRINGPFTTAHMFYKEALSKCDTYSDMYYNLMYEFTIFAAYIGLKTIPYELVQALNANRHTENIYQNMKFYKDILVPSKVHDLTTVSDPFYSSSMSILPYEDVYIANVRFVNYTIESGYHTKSGPITTLNKYIKLDLAFTILEEKVFTTPLLNTWTEGIEDIRLFNKDGIIFVGSIANENCRELSVCIGNYDITKDVLEYTKIKQRRSIEKNWVFVTFQDELHIVYKWNPFTLCSIKENELCTVIETPLPALFNHARGSTCGFTFNDEIWFIVHIVSYDSPRQYYNVFVVFDVQMNLKKYSAPFKFENDDIEYCIGLIIESTRIIASYSVNDNQTKLAVYDKSYIETKLFDHFL